MKNNNNKEYIRWKETRKRKRIVSVIGIALITAGAGVGVGYAIWHNSKSNPTPTDGAFDIVRYKTDKTPESGILKDDGDQIVLSAVNGDGEITWDGLNQIDTIPGLHYDDSVPSMLRIYVQGSTTSEAHVTITAKDQAGGVASDVVQIYKFTPKPVTTNYFQLGQTDVSNDTIEGFSNDVLLNPDILNAQGFNAFDFTGTDIKYIGSGCRFSTEIFKTWKVESINFKGLTFVANGSNMTGAGLFAYSNLSSLIELNFNQSVWYYRKPSVHNRGNINISQNIRTAYRTFENANLSGLSNLNLNGAQFLSGSVTTTFLDDSVYTADSTFHNANLSGLSHLDLNNARFASSEMGSACTIYTANSTFKDANFSGLTNLNLKGAIFVDNNMASNQSVIYTAADTFQNAKFSKLVNLDLKDVEFAKSSMSSNSTSIYTAFETFKTTLFLKLSNLNLEGARFAADNMTDGSAYTGSGTFMETIFSNLNNLNLNGAIFAATNMAKGEVRTAYDTFNGANLSILNKLDLMGVIFVIDGMEGSEIRTASQTFSNAHLETLVTLDLTNTAFAIDGMATHKNVDIYTADKTFNKAWLVGLNTLTLTNTIFATNDMAPSNEGDEWIADSTFGNITILNWNHLYLTKPYNTADKPWAATFSSPVRIREGFTIHNYSAASEVQAWFDTEGTWFPSAQWAPT